MTTTTRHAYMGDTGKMKSRCNDAKLVDDVTICKQELWDREHPQYNTIMERHVISLSSLWQRTTDAAAGH
jgi:hypothetical protein